MFILSKKIVLPISFAASLILVACDSQNTNTSTQPKQQESATISSTVKVFPQTADDQHDIAILDDYNQRMNELDQSVQADLEKLKQEGNLNPDFEALRLKDRTESALIMLKDLELKTEQGRYIQGLLSQHWEQQAKLQEKKLQQSDDNLLHAAHEQLAAWKKQVMPNQ